MPPRAARRNFAELAKGQGYAERSRRDTERYFRASRKAGDRLLDNLLHARVGAPDARRAP